MRKLKDGIKLYEHQAKGKDFILRRKYVLIGDEPGLGKTLQAMAAIVETNGLAVIVCPAFLRLNWKREILKFTNLSCQIVNAKTSYLKIPQVIISSYENVKNIPLDLMPNFLVLDESHYIKNMKAARTKAVIKMITECRPEYFVALSGTPILNNVTEFYSVLKLLSTCPSGTNGIPIQQRSQYGFSMKFANCSTRNILVNSKHGSKSVSITDFSGVKNVDLLKSYLKGKFLRRLAKSVLDLPKVTYSNFIMKMSKSKLKESMLELGEDIPEHITHIKIGAANDKVSATVKFCTELLEQREQVVVFSDHREPVASISAALEANYPVGVITGETDYNERDRIVQDFQSGKLRAIIGTIGAASTGLTLTAARHLVFNDKSWVPADNIQAERRVNRISQERPVTITSIINGEFDLKLNEKLYRKSKEIREVYE